MERDLNRRKDKAEQGKRGPDMAEPEKTKSGKLKIAVIFGGCSPEYGVSLESAYAVISHLDREKYEPVPVGITREGSWYVFEGEPEEIAEGTWHESSGRLPACFSPDRLAPGLLVLKGRNWERRSIDAAFPILHGKNGEDGTVQGMFELAGIPVIGCGVLSSALCMDKDRAHKLAAAAGVEVPASFVIRGDFEQEELLEKAGRLGYPLFVKPVKAGSSFGITQVTNTEGLFDAVETAFAYDDTVIVEARVPGVEVGCAVLEDGGLKLGEVDEIELAEGFFDFTEKYSLKTSSIHVPARIDRATADRVRNTARVVYRALDCSGFARVDMFLTPSGQIVFNEVNTIPGFTVHSRYPNMMKAAGVSFEQVLDSAIRGAVMSGRQQDTAAV